MASFTEKALAEIPIGAHILVKAGEIIPLDGKVIDGRSYVNLVHLTGESQPMGKTIGDEVPCRSRQSRWHAHDLSYTHERRLHSQPHY